MTQARTISGRLLRWALLLALIVSATPVSLQLALAAPAANSSAAPAAAPTNVLRLSVVSARAAGGHTLGEAVAEYKYLINEDNTGNVNDSDANCRPYDANGVLVNPTLANCQWPSIHKMQGDAPIVTQGTEVDFTTGLDLTPYITAHPGVNKFLISVVANGYQVGGQHFSLPLDSASNTVTVELEPNPLPTTTYRAMVFNDNTSPNGAMDVPGEVGLDGFEGIINEILGQVSTDWFGNPLCTEYYHFGDPNAPAGSSADPAGSQYAVDADGAYIPIPGTGGICLSGDSNHDGKVNPPTMEVDGTGTQVPNPDYNPAYPADNPADQGMLVIPNLGTDRVAGLAVPPDGSDWVQTTTLEGWHDYDTWMMAGATGYDTEFLYQNELFPWTVFGFVKPTFKKVDATSTSLPGNATYPGEVKGTVYGAKIYVPSQGGLGISSLGIMGAKKDYAVNRPWIALSDLNNGDQMVYAGRGNPDGTFDVKNVPPSDYLVTVWDQEQNLILDGLQIQVSVTNTVTYVGDTWNGVPGNIGIQGWWARFEGHVFIDNGKATDGTLLPSGTAANGKRDCYGPDRGPDPKSGLPLGSAPNTCEAGLPQQPVAFKMRGNSVMQHGTTAITTDDTGYYVGKQVYPINVWIVEEVYNDLYKTTGITYQADNQPTETTILGQGVDVNILPIIGLSGRLDWGVVPYARNENGGIVGTVTYDVTRNELDPRFAVTEDWQPGIPGLRVKLYAPVKCASPLATNCDSAHKYQIEADGSYTKGSLLNVYVTERWDRPTGCIARDVNGNQVVEKALPTDPNAECVEAPMSGTQFGPNSDGTNFGATVDGNYGFGDGCFGPGGFAEDPSAAATVPGGNPGACANGQDPTSLTPGNYLVSVEIPNDAWGKPLYKVTKEEDINIFSGDAYVPQVPPPACAGPLHTVHVVSDTAQANWDPANPSTTMGVYNPDMVDGGGSPWEGQRTPLCDTKLIPVQNSKSIAPNFNLFTEVPLPARFMGLLVDNLNLSTNPRSTSFGEVAGIPHTPYGVYDFAGRLLYTGDSDANGIWEVLMPSSLEINCPTPSGVCPNMYRFVGNDPGQPYHRNANWNPQYQTISAPFEAWPGVINPADLAPMPVAVTVEVPGGKFSALTACVLPTTQPKLFAVDRPYVSDSGGSIAITGDAFGISQGAGSVTLDGTAIPVNAWTNSVVTVTVPAGFPVGPHQLLLTTGTGQTLINGLTVHVLTTLPAFPTNGTLDTFNRAGTSNGLQGSWVDDSPNSVFNVASNQARVRTGNNVFDTWWNAATFGVSQEAYFTFVQVSPQAGANEQGLLLKYSGGSDPKAANAQWVEVTYDNDTSATAGLQPGVRISTKLAGGAPTTQLIVPTTFAANDQLGARALSDGTIVAYKGGVEIGRTNVAATAAWTGRIGVRFEGAGANNPNQAVFDNFGGGSLSLGTLYTPSVIEVGPGKAFDPTITTIDPITGLPYEHALQNALEAAASRGTALVVVYPNLATANANPAGEYFENIVVHSSVKLQGVGPGGVYTDTNNVTHVVPGSIIDGIGYSPDATPSTDWYALVASLLTPDPNGGDPTAVGNPSISDGEVVYVLPTSTTQFNAGFKTAIDGFTIQGGDQLGFPANINALGGGQTNGGRPTFQGDVPTQGGGIYVHGYAHYTQITNNVLQSNGGAYAGAIRVGTPTIANHNDNVRIAYNRIVANGGTNLAGAIGLFRNSDGYEVDHNDLCGNYSSEYGGAISHFGLSPNGKIHDNHIYYNQSVDEAAGIMIGGELANNPNANYGAPNGPQGAGAVDVYNNLIQSNIAGDDGGGLRFLMAGNFIYNVYNNFIVNNVSAHEGAGVALDDAPNVRFYNNTVMKNLSTDTATTAAFSTPYPAGLSTGDNSAQLQATLPVGSTSFSNPLLFNNIFRDNRAGSYNPATAQIEGLGLWVTDTIRYWDMGSTNGAIALAPTNSVLNGVPDQSNLVASPTNAVGANPLVAAYDTQINVFPWRSPNFPAPVIVSVDQPGTLPGDYHLQSGSPAIDMGASFKGSVNAPKFDIDNEVRPAGAACAYDSGADEVQTGGSCADLSITKSDGVTSVAAGAAVNYSIVVSNSGPGAVSGAPVTDNFPAALTVTSWTCTASAGSSCTVGGSGNSRTGTVTLAVGGSATFTAQTTLSVSATGSLANTATVAAAGGATDPNLANNSATDTDTVIPALPALTVLDNFNRANANSLNFGTNWSQVVVPILGASIRVNANQAFAALLGSAYWNTPASGFGAKQGAAFTFAAAPGGLVPNTLILKASGGSATAPANYISVAYSVGSGQVVVATTTNSGGTLTTRGTFAATFASGDTFSAVADATGTVYVYKTSGAVTTLVGMVTIPGAGFWTGAGRIGLQLPTNARVDNFSGGTLP